MSARSFVDTNVLVYLFDGRDPRKQARAAEVLQQLADEDEAPVVSTQVLQEAFVALTRKLHIDAGDALASMRELGDDNFRIQSIDAAMVWRAAERSSADQLSFWDALIVEAALEGDCTVLYSEDLQDGRTISNMVIRNPFA
jgi:predicted nucleic acid-binding protein